MLPKPPKAVLILIALLSLLAGLSGLLGLVLSLQGQRYLALGFEATLVMAGVFGVLTGLGRFRDGPGLATLCVGGAVFVCGTLSEPTLVPRLLGRGGASSVVMGVDLVMLAIVRVVCGLALIALAAMIVLVRRPKASMGLVMRGALVGLPVAATLVLAGSGSVRGFVAGLQPVVVVPLVVVGVLVLGACLSVSIHCFIRGFEMGREEP